MSLVYVGLFLLFGYLSFIYARDDRELLFLVFIGASLATYFLALQSLGLTVLSFVTAFVLLAVAIEFVVRAFVLWDVAGEDLAGWYGFIYVVPFMWIVYLLIGGRN